MHSEKRRAYASHFGIIKCKKYNLNDHQSSSFELRQLYVYISRRWIILKEYMNASHCVILSWREHAYTPLTTLRRWREQANAPLTTLRWRGEHVYAPLTTLRWRGEHAYAPLTTLQWRGEHSYAPLTTLKWRGEHAYAPHTTLRWGGEHAWAPLLEEEERMYISQYILVLRRGGASLVLSRRLVFMYHIVSSLYLLWLSHWKRIWFLFRLWQGTAYPNAFKKRLQSESICITLHPQCVSYGRQLSRTFKNPWRVAF